MTGLPVTRVERTHRSARPALGRARVPQRARARHRRDHRGRPRGGRPRATRRRGAVQRVVGLRPHPRRRRARGEPPVVEGGGIRAGLRRPRPLHARARPLGVLLPPPAQRAVGRRSSSPASRSTTAPSAAATAPSHQDPAQRLDHWCGRCDKCCFVDLVLAPFMDRVDLEAVFAGDEPLQNPANEERFRALLGLGDGAKPFECVGDVDECRAATGAGRPARRTAPATTSWRGCAPSWATPHPPTPTPSCSRGAPTAFRIAMRRPDLLVRAR